MYAQFLWPIFCNFWRCCTLFPAKFWKLFLCEVQKLSADFCPKYSSLKLVHVFGFLQFLKINFQILTFLAIRKFLSPKSFFQRWKKLTPSDYNLVPLVNEIAYATSVATAQKLKFWVHKFSPKVERTQVPCKSAEICIWSGLKKGERQTVPAQTFQRELTRSKKWKTKLFSVSSKCQKILVGEFHSIFTLIYGERDTTVFTLGLIWLAGVLHMVVNSLNWWSEHKHQCKKCKGE